MTRHWEHHGMSYSPEYQVWRNMLSRCTNPNHPRYADWGGRGITVCDRWLSSFIAFYEDMGDCPSGYELDRKDNDGNYGPDNCRWVPRSTSQRNKRKQSDTTSKYMGVYWHPGAGKWHARIRINNRYRNLGLYTVEEDARDAYNNALLEVCP